MHHSSYCVSYTCGQSSVSQSCELPLTYIQSEGAWAIDVLITIDTDKRIASLVQWSFKTDDDELKVLRSMRAYIICNLGDVGIIQRRVDLVQNEEWWRLIAMITSFAIVSEYTEFQTAHLWIAKSRASAAMVFSPPESCSMSRKRFIGGIAWYLIPAAYGSWENVH